MSNISPLKQYQNLVDSKKISCDVSQQQAVEQLQELFLNLQRINSKSNETLKAIKGIYLWGKVGRGKTFLMDLFVNCLVEKFDGKLCKRQHFHHFMRDIHSQLNELSGKSEPLKIIARKFSQQYHVLCFDEFFVSDIGDAMLLGNLLQFMFDLNIVVVCTSNCEPIELYRNGLQRERFLPAIDAIEQNTHILHLNGEHDHRLRTLTFEQNYFELPYSEEDQLALHQILLDRFGLKLQNTGKNSSVIETGISVLGRKIPYIAKNIEEGKQVICFEFSALCQGPRSHFDYIELAKIYKTILLFNIPPMSGQAFERIKARGTEDNGSNINVSANKTGEREVVLAPMDDAVRRFIALVDECYDCQVNLFLTAYVPQNELYKSGALMFEFERTKSRLVEMGSLEYLNNK
jgi:cell division protein ZapE